MVDPFALPGLGDGSGLGGSDRSHDGSDLGGSEGEGVAAATNGAGAVSIKGTGAGRKDPGVEKDPGVDGCSDRKHLVGGSEFHKPNPPPEKIRAQYIGSRGKHLGGWQRGEVREGGSNVVLDV